MLVRLDCQISFITISLRFSKPNIPVGADISDHQPVKALAPYRGLPHTPSSAGGC